MCVFGVCICTMLGVFVVTVANVFGCFACVFVRVEQELAHVNVRINDQPGSIL